ncbi:MAG: hypothetical protein DHS80DRAFT_30470 [Piptocephalis tieghemiana]|nr:MAG: hypothetical protein DHS80DRAFT_30470 [Piptocephalis tieghemiana]
MPLDFRTTQRLRNLSKDLEESAQILEDAFTQLGDAAVEAEAIGETDLVKELDALARRLVRNQTEAKQHHEAFQDALSLSISSHTIEGFSDRYQQGVREKGQASRDLNEQQRYMNDPNYLNFRQRIWEVNHPDEEMPLLLQRDHRAEDEVIIETARTSLQCPLTAQYLEDPVTKHNYSKDAVVAYVKSLTRQRRVPLCPITGCQAILSMSALHPNPQLNRMVARAKQRDEEEATSQSISQVIREVN